MKNNKRSIMYSPLSKILKDYKEGKTEHWETHDKILGLFNVVEQSEQLPDMTLEQAISQAKTNMDKIKDVDKYLDDIR